MSPELIKDKSKQPINPALNFSCARDAMPLRVRRSLRARQWRRVCGEGDSQFAVTRVRVACDLNIVSRDNGGSI